ANGVEALRYMVDFQNNVYGGWQKVAALSSDDVLTALYNSKNAIYISGPWMFQLIKDNGPTVYQNLGVAQRPRNKGKYIGAVIGDGVGLWLLKGNKHPDESWLLLDYLSVGDGGCAFLQAQARPSPVKACNEDQVYYKANAWWDKVLASLEAE